MLKDHKRLLCQFGAGKGKSRVAAALAYLFLSTTTKKIYMVYPDRGLMRRDREQCKYLWKYAGLVDEKGFQRLQFITDLTKIEKNKKSIIVVDESDAIIMKDPEMFAESTMGCNLEVVCLTATPDDDIDEGVIRCI